MKPYNPAKIGIIGSEARGESTPESDIDVLYEFRDTISLFKLVRLRNELERKLNKKIDLVSEKYTHPKLKPQILHDLKIIYGG
jgi:predicted nucleotidyltransferase